MCLAVLFLVPSLLLGVMAAFAAFSIGLVVAPVVAGGLLGLGGLVRLSFASLGQRAAPAWAIVGTSAGLLAAIPLLRAGARLGVSGCLHHWTRIDASQEGNVFCDERVVALLDAVRPLAITATNWARIKSKLSQGGLQAVDS